MHCDAFSRRLAAALFATLLACLPLSSAHAIPTGIVPEPLDEFQAPSPTAAQGVCALGETRFPNLALLPSLGIGDVHYRLLTPGQCTACPAHVLVINSITAKIRTRIGGCAIRLKVTLVDANLSGTCYTPSTIALCPSVDQIVSFQGAGVFDFVVPMPQPCCISRPVFVRVEVIGNSCPGADTGMTFFRDPPTCVPCSSYWYNAASLTLSEMCAFGAGSGLSTAIFADADCCNSTSGAQRSWGSLKTYSR